MAVSAVSRETAALLSYDYPTALDEAVYAYVNRLHAEDPLPE